MPTHVRIETEVSRTQCPLGGAEITFLFLMKADGERTIEKRLAADPWTPMNLLRIARIEP